MSVEVDGNEFKPIKPNKIKTVQVTFTQTSVPLTACCRRAGQKLVSEMAQCVEMV